MNLVGLSWRKPQFFISRASSWDSRFDLPERDRRQVIDYQPNSPFAYSAIDVSALYGSTADYGNYEVLGNLVVNISGTQNVTFYKRSLDLDTAIHEVTYKSNGVDFTT